VDARKNGPDSAAVRTMFDRIAPVYDRLNTVMTAGIDARWRRAALDAATLRPDERVVDVATGTGKLALGAAQRVGSGGEVVGLDTAPRMLARARAAAGGRAVRWLEADAMAMPLADAAFDAVTIGFGLRNLPDLDAALREMARVLRPGGRLVVLEVAEPPGGVARLVFGTWFRRVVPFLGRLAGEPAAYAYLPDSLRRYPPPAAVAGRMAAAGFDAVSWRWLPTRLATLHVGTRGSGP
jgi:demethylmenaquinone methyltransferase / 2-methoxy-6-polyprenyl-1,4-benzoquinol methylase